VCRRLGRARAPTIASSRDWFELLAGSWPTMPQLSSRTLVRQRPGQAVTTAHRSAAPIALPWHRLRGDPDGGRTHTGARRQRSPSERAISHPSRTRQLIGRPSATRNSDGGVGPDERPVPSGRGLSERLTIAQATDPSRAKRMCYRWGRLESPAWWQVAR
jgi:hypothetical protein